MKTVGWVVALAFVAATAACGPGSETPREPAARETAAKDVTQAINPSTATKLRFGETLEVVADLPRMFDGETVLFASFAENDVLVGDVTPVLEERTEPATWPILAQEHPVMYDLRTKTFTLLDDRDRAEPTQVTDIFGNEAVVVWVELAGTSVDTSKFTFYSYDRQSKKVTTIGVFDDPDGQIVYGNDLQLAGDTAYFSTPAYPKKRGQEAVYAVPVDGSKPPRVIAAGGMHAKVVGGTLSYQVANPHDKREYPRFFTYDVSTGATTPVRVSAHVDDPGFCGAEVTKEWETWCVGRVAVDDNQHPARLTLKETSGRVTEFGAFPTDSLNSPIPHGVVTLGRWTGIAVTADGGQEREFLVDLDTKDVRMFPGNTSFGALSPDRSTVLVSSFANKGPGPQRIVRIPVS